MSSAAILQPPGSFKRNGLDDDLRAQETEAVATTAMRNTAGKAVLPENTNSLEASARTQKHESPLMQSPSSGVYALLS